MYSIKRVSELLNIPAVTIRAWEQRYQVIAPARSHGGQRIYSDDDVRTLQRLKQLMDEHNLKISEAVMMLNNQATGSSEKADEPVSSRTAFDGLIDRLYDALVDVDALLAHETIDMAFSLHPFDTVVHHLFAPVLVRIGDEWEQGKVTVAQEHFASQLIMQRCVQLFRILPIQKHLPRALAFCPEGEEHHIGLMLFSLFLRKKGLEVIYLGPNTPLHELVRLIELKQISVISVSLTDTRHMEALEKWVAACRTVYPNMVFSLGGPAFRSTPSSLSSYIVPEDTSEWEAWYSKMSFNKQNIKGSAK